MFELSEQKVKVSPTVLASDHELHQQLNEKPIVYNGYKWDQPAPTDPGDLARDNADLLEYKEILEQRLLLAKNALHKKPNIISGLLLSSDKTTRWDEVQKSYDQGKKEYDVLIGRLKERRIYTKDTHSLKDSKESTAAAKEASSKCTTELHRFIKLVNENLKTSNPRNLQFYQGLLQNINKTVLNRTSQFSKMIASFEALGKMAPNPEIQKQLQREINLLLVTLTNIFKDITTKYKGEEWQPLLELIHKKMNQAYQAGLFEIIPANIQNAHHAMRDAHRTGTAPKMPPGTQTTLALARDFFNAFKQLPERPGSKFTDFCTMCATYLDETAPKEQKHAAKNINHEKPSEKVDSELDMSTVTTRSRSGAPSTFSFSASRSTTFFSSTSTASSRLPSTPQPKKNPSPPSDTSNPLTTSLDSSQEKELSSSPTIL